MDDISHLEHVDVAWNRIINNSSTYTGRNVDGHKQPAKHQYEQNCLQVYTHG